MSRKLTTPKQVLKAVRDDYLNVGQEFICISIQDLKDISLISDGLRWKTERILKNNKPNENQFTKYTKSKYWSGCNAWWHGYIGNGKFHYVMKIKKKYLTELINTL